MQPRIRIQQNGLARRFPKLLPGEHGRALRAIARPPLTVHNLRGGGGFRKKIAVVAVGRHQPDLKTALPKRRERQAETFRRLVQGVEVGKAQCAEGKPAPKREERHPREPPAFANAALAVNHHAGRQQQRNRPRHREVIYPAVDICRLQRFRAQGGAKRLMMQVVGQNAADQQRRREIHQMPPARKRFVLPPPHLQRGEQAEKRREHLRHIVQIPQVAVDLSSLKEAVFHRAQKQPQHRHRAAEHQIAPHPSMQDSMRNGKSPRHGQPDVDQVGQQEEHGGWQRRSGTIKLAKHAGEDEQPERQTEFRHRAPFNASHSPTSRPNRADRHTRRSLKSIFTIS